MGEEEWSQQQDDVATGDTVVSNNAETTTK
jgi:hypothetical protein